MRLLLASRNRGKIREFQRALRGLPVDLLSGLDFPNLPEAQETGRTFADNARLKALHYRELTGIPTLADDSGLEVQALDGAPGVHSARFAPTSRERIERLLSELRRIKAWNNGRRPLARFVCTLCLALPNQLVEVRGEVEGEILQTPRGKEGFGYDPVFFYPPLGKTFGELEESEKNQHSHRAIALRRLWEVLVREGEREP